MSEESEIESKASESESDSTDIVEEDDIESKASESESDSTDIVEEDDVVLAYPDRVPNSKRGVDHKHSYVMIGLVVAFLLFSLIVSNFTISY